MRSVTIAAPVQRQLLAATRDRLPAEMVAALAGSIEATHATVTTMVELTNLVGSSDSFRVDPMQLARAEGSFRTRGLQLLGFAHSHPNGEPSPSRTDRRELWRNYLHVVIADDGRHQQCAAFVLHGDAPSVQRVEILQEQPA